MVSRLDNRRGEAFTQYEKGVHVEHSAPGKALQFYRRAQRANTRIHLDVLFLAILTPLLAAWIVDQYFTVVSPFWEGVVFAALGIFPAVLLAYLRGFGGKQDTDPRTFGNAGLLTLLLVYSDFMTLVLLFLSLLVGMLVILTPVSLGYWLTIGMPPFRFELLPEIVTRPAFFLVLYVSLVMWFTNVPLMPFRMRRVVVDGIAGLLAAWDELAGLVARFGLVAVAVSIPSFSPYEIYASSAVAGLLLGIALFRVRIDEELSSLNRLGRLRALFLQGRRTRVYHLLTELIEDTKEDDSGIRTLVCALAHQDVLYASQVISPSEEPGCLGALLWSTLNQGLTLLPWFEQSPADLLEKARRSQQRSFSLEAVWPETVARTEEVVRLAVRERRTKGVRKRF